MKPVIDAEPVYEGIPQGLTLKNLAGMILMSVDMHIGLFFPVHLDILTEITVLCNFTFWYNTIVWSIRKLVGRIVKNPGFNQMKYLKELILKFPFFERIPDQSNSREEWREI